MLRTFVALALALQAPGGSPPVAAPVDTLLPGMPAPLDTHNLYAGIGAGMLDSVARRAMPLVYVPLGGAGRVAEIDPQTFRVLRVFATGAVPQHVVPAYDLRTLWVVNDRG